MLTLTALVSVSLVSTSPQVTEWVFQLGKGSDLAAVSSMSDYPEAAKALPRLGPLFAPGIERVLKFAPDWVLSDGWTEPPGLDRALKAAGISHFQSRISSVEDLFRSSERLLKTIYGETTSEPLERFRRCTPDRTGKEPFTFLAFVWSSPPILFGRRTFLSDLLARLGGENALPAGWESPYPQVSEEWLLRREFSTIFFLDDTPDAGPALRRLAEKLWPGKKIRFVPMETAHFGRASFTPLVHVDKLRPGSRPAGCPL